VIPLCVFPSELSTLSLFREREGAFRVVDPGPLGCLITGYDFILAERTLADFLVEHSLGEIVAIDALIFRQTTAEVWSSHVELSVPRVLTPESLPMSAFDDGLAWCFNRSALFVHPDVATALKATNFGVRLSEGFAEFA
jgi:hypothetical protein